MAPVQLYLKCLAQLGLDPDTERPDDNVYVRFLNEANKPQAEVYHLKNNQLVIRAREFLVKSPWKGVGPLDNLYRPTGPGLVPVEVLAVIGHLAHVRFVLADKTTTVIQLPHSALVNADGVPIDFDE